MDKSIKDATWEQENTIKTNFPNFSLQEGNVLGSRPATTGSTLKYSGAKKTGKIMLRQKRTKNK